MRTIPRGEHCTSVIDFANTRIDYSEMTDGFQQDYYCLQLLTADGELMRFDLIPGEVCRMIHLGKNKTSMREMALVSQDTRRLNITRMFPKGKRVRLSKIGYMIVVQTPRGRIVKQEFWHPFTTPTYLRNGKLYSTQKNLIRTQPLNTLFKYPFPNFVVGSQFIS